MLVIASVGPIVLCVFARVTELPYVTCVQNYQLVSQLVVNLRHASQHLAPRPLGLIAFAL